MVSELKRKEDREQLKSLDLAQLRQQLVEAKEELFNLRFQLATGHLTDHSQVGQVRRRIARIHTVIRQQEMKEPYHV